MQSSSLSSVSIEQRIQAGKERLSRYVSVPRNDAKEGVGDKTQELFEAMLEHGPKEGKQNTLSWIFSPKVSLGERLILTERCQMENDSPCDDERLYWRHMWWRMHLLQKCNLLPICKCLY
jgi:hypothetical protein